MASVSLVAVDLAAKFSAACWLSDQRQVLSQWDSWQHSETTFIDFITSPWAEGLPMPQALLVEDLPHGVGYRTLVKDVCRLQGRIVERMDAFGCSENVVFVQPYAWRNAFPELRKKGGGAPALVTTAGEHGYVPPDLRYRLRGEKGEKATARKIQTDYCAAFLIAWWAMSCWYEYGTLDVPGTQRYGEPLQRKESTSGKGS
jgi:hypothetical protein